MKVTDTKIPDVKIIEPTVFKDERGYFYESFNHKKFVEAIGRSVTFLQDNHSKPSKGVFRGLHYQLPPHGQEKLVRVVQGEIISVVLDVRETSPTYGKWFCRHFSEDEKLSYWVPEGFAHGFLTISEFSQVVYKTSEYYMPEFEQTIKWNSRRLNIYLDEEVTLISEKDKNGIEF